MEMKPHKRTPAHVSDDFAELVCSNSLRSDELSNAVGLLKEEMRRLDGLIISCADATRLPAGGALAVDRVAFAKMITDKIRGHERIAVVEREADSIPEGTVVIATGPLTSDAMAARLRELTRGGVAQLLRRCGAYRHLRQHRHVERLFRLPLRKGSADYVNCPMSQEEYEAFRREQMRRGGGPCPRPLTTAVCLRGCLPLR